MHPHHNSLLLLLRASNIVIYLIYFLNILPPSLHLDICSDSQLMLYFLGYGINLNSSESG